MRRRVERPSGLLTSIVAMALTAATLLRGQSSSSSMGSVDSATSGDYVLGHADVISVTIGDAPELSGSYRVTETGYVALPSLSAPIKSEGLTVQQESQAVAAALKRDKLLRDPRVNVFVLEYHSRTVTVLGSVLKPSVYSLQSSTTLLEVLSLAGGLAPTAGNTVQLMHKATERSPGAALTDTIELAKLLSGADPLLNKEVRPGDVITVSTAPVVYVIGAVMKPGGYALQDANSPITVLKALAMAQGLTPLASRSRGLILRRDRPTQNQEISVDVGKLLTGKVADVTLQGNDVLFIPESGVKKGLSTLRVAALEAMEGVSVYGIGYRISGLR